LNVIQGGGQNRAMRAILNVSRFTKIKSMLEQLEWMNIRKDVRMNVFAFIYKLENNELPNYFNKYMINHLDLHSHNTRNKNKLVLKN